jgi:menaquinone-dependent protoporphyrinogen oxidase
MKVLVVYASRYGSTKGIAERIAATLRQSGLEAVAQPAQDADSPAGYAATVIGSAAYYFHWMGLAKKYVRRYCDVLANKPVWLFSSGPLGSKPNDAQGRDFRVVLEPKEIAEFRETIEPLDHRVFFGAMNSSKLGFLHRLVYKLPANRDNAMFPEGDFRDWGDIESWADGISKRLTA